MKLELKYSSPAPDSDEGWESRSLPLGCGWFGANIFGIPERERIQITENSFQNAREFGGLTNFAELYIEQPDAAEYDRDSYTLTLSLDDAIAYCRFKARGIVYEREYFTSYPDRMLAVRLNCSMAGSLSFILRPKIPFIRPYADKPGDGGGRSGSICVAGDTALMDSTMQWFGLRGVGRISVDTDGFVKPNEDTIEVNKATYAVIFYTCATNYMLCSEVFSEPDPKKKLAGSTVNPEKLTLETLINARLLGYMRDNADSNVSALK